MPARSLDQIVNLCKRRGFVFPGSAAYGGLGSFWDYGPLGVEMLRNVKEAWWKDSVYARDDMEGLDAALLMSRKVWQHSGHEATFGDLMVDDKKTKRRFRLDHLLKDQQQPVLADLLDQSLALAEIVFEHVAEEQQAVDQALENVRRKRREMYQDFLGGDELGRYIPPTATDPVIRPRNIASILSDWRRIKTRKPDDYLVRNWAKVEREQEEKEWAEINEPVELLRRNLVPPEDVPSLVNSWIPLLLELVPHVQELESAIWPLDAANVRDPDTEMVGEWTYPRQFNLMFMTHVGPVSAATGSDEELAHRVYLRPETAQGIFMNFVHVQRAMARKVPFGIAQMGKAFRNEITPGNFIFRTREFEQMEIEFFIKPPQFVQEGEKTDDEWHREWIDRRHEWWLKYSTPSASTGGDARDTEQAARFRKREQTPDELAHYAKATTDIEYLFPGSLGWGEIEGVANRTDYDLSAHSKDVPEDDLERLKLEPNKDSNEKFDYFDPDAKQRYIPWVIEPSAGVTRAVLTFLCEAYHEEMVSDPTKQEVDQVKSDVAMIIKNAEKKIKQAEKDAEKGNQPKHDAEAVRAFIDKLAEARDGLPDSLMAVEDAFNHEGAQNLEPVKKFRPWLEKLVERVGRRVLRLHPALAPVKLAVFPLKKNKPELVDLAKSIKAKFARDFRVVYDDSAGIGRLYRRQDEIGTPFCITVDFQSLEDDTVTVRERDSMEQQRVKVDDLESHLLPLLR